MDELSGISISDDCPDRYLDDEILSIFSMELFDISFFSIDRTDNFLVSEVRKGIYVWIPTENNISTSSTVATIGATFWDKDLTSPSN
jgi:hypothetical protein